MKLISTKTLSLQQKESVLNLWNNGYPAQLAYKSIQELDNYLANLANTSHYFIYKPDNEITGWAVVFERENETWFAIIVNSSHHHNGLGSHLLAALKNDHTILNGWVIDHLNYRKQNGDVYPSPLGFYLKNGFRVQKEVRLDIPVLSAVKITWNSDL